MFKFVRSFCEGFNFHARGIRFGFSNFSFLLPSVIPFVVTSVLYVFAFYMFTLHADDLLRMVWNIDNGETSRYVGWLYLVYTHVVKYFLYLMVLVIMFYTFVVVSNVIASPVYDYLSAKYERNYYPTIGSEQKDSSASRLFTVVKEEAKKALLMLIIPLPLLLVPVVGTVLSFMAAAIFIAWDYVDFSLARHSPQLKDRAKLVWQHKFMLLGFGCPLLVPFLGLAIMPFAILGSTKLYFDRIKISATGG